jgi:hypothetical protein
MTQFAHPSTLNRMRAFTAVASLLVLLLAASAALAQNDVKSITVNVDAGTTQENNVGAGFALIEQLATELNVHLTSVQGEIKSSELVSAAPGVNWVKVSETHWRAAGVGPNDPFWCVIKCEMAFPGGQGGEGGEPPIRWMSVSYVDLDADTDNDSQAAHRPPSRSEEEDHLEYPGAVASDVIGLIIPINDNNDVNWLVRDGSTPMNRDEDPDILDHVLEIRPRKAGEWTALFYGGFQYTEDGTRVGAADRTLNINQDVVLNLRLESDWDATSGSRNTAWGYFTPNEPRAGVSARDAFRYIFLGCDIDVDSNNDGNITADRAYNSGADFLEAHPSDSDRYLVWPEFKFGMIVAVNDDDDDNDGHPDNGWNGTDWTGPNADTIRGAEDLDDLRPGILRGLGVDANVKAMIDELDPVLVIKKVSGPGAIRLFTESGHHHIGAFIDNDDSVDEVDGTPLWDQLYGGTDMGLLVEGLRGGEVILGYQLWVNGLLIHHDEVRITVASWMMPSHRDVVHDVYVTTGMAAATRTAVENAIPEGVNLIEITSPDLWIQDQMLVGFRSWPTGVGSSWQTAMLNSSRHRTGSEYGPPFLHNQVNDLLGPGQSVYWFTPPDDNTFNSFGNVDAFPPTQSETHGRIYYGWTNNPTPNRPQISQSIRDFFAQQAELGPQAEPVTFNTSWLSVGHIDEIMSIQMTGNDTFRAIVADAQMGIDILANADQSEVLIAAWLATYIDPETIGDIRNDLDGFNTNIAATLDDLATSLVQMGLQVVRVPAYFAEVTRGGEVYAVSLLPNMVNMLNVNGTLITLDPMFEPFRQAMENALGGVEWIGDFNIHGAFGGLHCATNTRREPHDSLKEWWKDD